MRGGALPTFTGIATYQEYSFSEAISHRFTAIAKQDPDSPSNWEIEVFWDDSNDGRKAYCGMPEFSTVNERGLVEQVLREKGVMLESFYKVHNFRVVWFS